MTIRLTHLRQPLTYSRSFDACVPIFRSISSFEAVENAIKCAVETKEYLRIPHLVVSLKEPYQNSMLFSFLCAFHHHHRIRVIDEILQSFVPVRPLSVADIINEMKLIGYTLDTGTCNYLVSSLCVVDKLDEAIQVVEESDVYIPIFTGKYVCNFLQV